MGRCVPAPAPERPEDEGRRRHGAGLGRDRGAPRKAAREPAAARHRGRRCTQQLLSLPTFRLKAEATTCWFGICGFRLQPEDRAGDNDSAVTRLWFDGPVTPPDRGPAPARETHD